LAATVNDKILLKEYANAHKLQQDHPCLLDIIRRQHLNKPSPSDVPLFLDYPNVNKDQSAEVK
jgi:hypothetical protein